MSKQAPQAPKSGEKSASAMTEAQRAYETKRAAKAGMSLDKWLDAKRREQESAAREEAKKLAKAEEAKKKPGFFGRLLERAQKPL